MSELSFRRRSQALQRRLDESEQVIRALVSGEIDALVAEGSATPILLHAAQAKLQANEQLLRAVFDGAMDAMLIADDAGCTVDANVAACALFGLSLEWLVGRKVSDFGDPEFAQSEPQARLADDGQLERRFRMLRPDGGRRDTDHRVTPGILPGLNLTVLRDMTERRRAERTLEEAQVIAHLGSEARPS